MNQFIRTTACARADSPGQAQFAPRGKFLLRLALGASCLLSLLAAPLAAQRVEFPTPVQPVQSTSPYTVQPSPYTVQPSPYAAPSTPAAPSPYSVTPAPSYGTPTPTYGTPAPTYTAPPTTAPVSPPPFTSSPPPTYSPAAVGPPPAFDPYTSGGSITPAPPVAAPYGATPPPLTPYAQQPAPPYQPAPYDITTAGEGYWAKTQRLLQEISFEYTFLYGKQSDPSDLGINEVELSATFAYPMFGNIETPLLVTPGFQTDWFQGPSAGPPPGPDLPPRVYAAYLDFAWFPKCNEWLGGELGLQPGIWTDFNNVDSDSIRLLGRGVGTMALSPNLDLRLGIVYLDRADVKMLPVAGVYYRPTPEWDMYLVFPNPKVRKFISAVGNTKWWWYVAGEYGGGSWTVEREQGDDRIDYNDIRVFGGVEWETQTHIRGHLEAGFVFDREVVFVSQDPPNFKPDETLMLRAGVSF